MARIAVGGFHHETNCFVEPKTDFAYFAAHRDRPPLVRGPDVIEWLTNTSFALSGFFSDMGGGHEYVPLIWTSGGAGGMVTRDAFERIAGEMVGMLSQQMPVDAIYLDLHGAGVSEDFEDPEGELLRRVRAAVGATVPIVISLDYHANVTQQMVELTDGLVGYWTYPHVDRVETGQRAARVMKMILEHGQPKGRALRRIPFLIPLNSQCTMVNPSKGIIEKSAQLERGDQVLNVSYLAGFPPADLEECGPGVIVHAYTQAKADELADELAREIVANEGNFAAPLLEPDEAVQEAMRIAQKASRPVVIADTQDNPGAGGTGDTTGMLAALVRNNAQGAVLGIFYDAEAAAAAHKAGEGAEIAIALGGKFGPEGSPPYKATFKVVKLGDGKMRTTGPSVGGRNIDLGPMALLQIGGVRVVVSSKRMQAHDQAPFRHLGVEPKDQKILVLKSTVHFRADFEPIAEQVLVAVAPGGHIVDPTKYDYKRLRKGVRLFPLGPEFSD
ncbi:MAG TPA: M81 family metallopeptidase [Burkholderiales bacterium]|nr:M81 family metallopeptidase [Burkholderiales bacterium]